MDGCGISKVCLAHTAATGLSKVNDRGLATDLMVLEGFHVLENTLLPDSGGHTLASESMKLHSRG